MQKKLDFKNCNKFPNTNKASKFILQVINTPQCVVGLLLFDFKYYLWLPPSFDPQECCNSTHTNVIAALKHYALHWVPIPWKCCNACTMCTKFWSLKIVDCVHKSNMKLLLCWTCNIMQVGTRNSLEHGHVVEAKWKRNEQLVDLRFMVKEA